MAISNANKETANLARAFEEHILRTIKNADHEVRLLKQQYENSGQFIIVGINDEDWANSHPIIHAGIFDENGDLIETTGTSVLPVNIADREYFHVHRNNAGDNLYISKPVVGRISGKWSIQVTSRINKADHSFGGVALVSVDPFYFTQFYKDVDLGEYSSIALVGWDGVVRARQSESDTEVGQDISDTDIFKHLVINQVGNNISLSPVDGIERIYSYRALSEYPLTVIVGVATRVALKEANQRILSYFPYVIMISLIIIAFSASLIILAIRQRRTDLELQIAHDNLESQVQERTSELYISNNELQKTNQRLEEEIVERTRAEEASLRYANKIRHMAFYDSLTGLPNRAQLKHRLKKEINKASHEEKTIGVLFIDVDDLKLINDTFGHNYGDTIIVQTGKRINAALGEEAFVARISGDEFIVLLPGKTDRQEIVGVVKEILQSIRQKIEILSIPFNLTASIGIAIYPADGNTAEEIVKNADNAMYAAKRSGKNSWRFYKKNMHAEAYEKMRMTSSLRAALDAGEMSLYYQPQIDMASKAVVGFEALLRWKNPELGEVPPAQFIPLAEQSGFIHQIGKWVIKQACNFAHSLSLRGWNNIKVAVNISSKQLAEDDFVIFIRNAISEAGIRPEQLELEITESSLMDSLDEARKKLSELVDLGVQLALDDFGTGYSSLTYLRNLPVKTLKVDKSFIDLLETDDNVAKITGSIIDMAHKLDLAVVAEGVENDTQLLFLSRNNCDRIQGFIYSRPVTEAETLALLSASGRNAKAVPNSPMR